MEYLVFARTAYAEPLALVASVEAASAPTLDDVDVGRDWLELVLVPADDVIWIVRDGEVRASSSDSGRHTPRASSSDSGRHTPRASSSDSGRHTS